MEMSLKLRVHLKGFVKLFTQIQKCHASSDPSPSSAPMGEWVLCEKTADFSD